MDDDLRQYIEKLQPSTLNVAEPFLYFAVLQYKLNHEVACFPKEVDAGNKQQQVNDTRYDDPFP